MLYYRELNELLTMIELEVYNNDGIIYDTFVCDRILAKHNTNIYIKNLTNKVFSKKKKHFCLFIQRGYKLY